MPTQSAVAPTETGVAAPTQSAAAGPATTPQPQQPTPQTAQDLIAADLQAGKIDFQTSLLFRAYAVTGSAKLPAAYQGVPSADDDTDLAITYAAGDPRVDAATETQLGRYLGRPTDPSSVFARPTASVDTTARVASRSTSSELGGGEAAAPASGAPGPAGSPTPCAADGWSTMQGAHPVKVWAPCFGGYALDLAKAVSVIDSLWDPETAVMGQPLLDRGEAPDGGDTSIDVYLVDRPDDCPRAGVCNALPDYALAMAVPCGRIDAAAAGHPDDGASGYIIIPRSKVPDPLFADILAHELFHILEFAHQAKVTPFWFYEASARWAEDYFVPESRAPVIYPSFTEFQISDVSLTDTSTLLHPYDAFIWPYFMVQESGGPNIIGDAWRALENADSPQDAEAAVDGVLPANEHFRDFAVRDFNEKLDPGDPIGTHFNDADSGFPDGVMPSGSRVMDAPALESKYDGVPIEFPRSLPSLTADYTHFTVDSDVRQIRLDFSGLGQPDDFDVDALVKTKDGHWERRFLPSDGDTRWCRNDPSDDISEFYLIVSNHAYQSDRSVSGSYTVTPETACSGYTVDVVDTWVWSNHNLDETTQQRLIVTPGTSPFNAGHSDGSSVSTRDDFSLLCQQFEPFLSQAGFVFPPATRYSVVGSVSMGSWIDENHRLHLYPYDADVDFPLDGGSWSRTETSFADPDPLDCGHILSHTVTVTVALLPD